MTTPHRQGEVCVAGTALALGYYRDPQRTGASFVQNPLNQSYPEIIYRTGDMACYGPDGLLYFQARKDFQIKHMGHRIELGEIETALMAVEGVTGPYAFSWRKKTRLLHSMKGMPIKGRLPPGWNRCCPAICSQIFTKIWINSRLQRMGKLTGRP